MRTTDFDEWLPFADLEDLQEAYALYTVVKNNSKYSLFWSESINDEGQMISCVNSPKDKLILGSKAAINLFLKHLEKKYCKGQDMEFWHALETVLEKKD
jgi:hypothetical protein